MQFDPEWAGRKVRCPECGAPMTVPRSVSKPPAEPTPAPFVSESAVVPVPPPLPPALPGSSPVSSGVSPPLLPVDKPFVPEDEVVEILAHVFSDVQNDRAEEVLRNMPVPPRILPPAPEPRSPWIARFLVILFLLAAFGAGGTVAYVWLNQKPPNQHLLAAREYRVLSDSCLIEAHERERTSVALLRESQNLWTKADKMVDNVIAAIADLYEKRLAAGLIEEDGSMASVTVVPNKTTEDAENARMSMQAVQAAELRLKEHRQEWAKLTTTAGQGELESDRAIVEWIALREKADEQMRLSDEEYRLAAAEGIDLSGELHKGERQPMKRPMLVNTILADRFQDQTEGFFTDFAFPEKIPDRFFALFDPTRRLGGTRSLRLTGIGMEEIVVRLPAKGTLAWRWNTGDLLRLAFRFPEISEMLGTVFIEEDQGKFDRIAVVLGNEAGHVRFEASLPQYMELLFLAGRGEFTPVEIPIAGNTYWVREDRFDPAKLPADEELFAALPAGERQAGALEPPLDGVHEEVRKKWETARFFRKIEWLEIRLQPRTPLTTFWIDGLYFADRAVLDPIDLELMERYLAPRRERDANLLFERRSNRSRQLSATTLLAAALPEKTGKTGPDAADREQTARQPVRELEAGTPVERENRFANIITQTFGGSVEVEIDGVTRRFKPGEKVPVPDFQHIIGIDLSGCRILKDTDFDRIGTLRALQWLNLSGTGMTDGALIKLSMLDRMERLDLSRNEITMDALPHLIAMAERLTELKIEGCLWGQNGLAPVGRFVNLRTLSLAGAEFDNRDLGFLIMLSKLETLSLEGTNVSDRGLRYLEPLGTLRKLDLRGTRVTSAGVAELKKHCPRLEISGR